MPDVPCTCDLPAVETVIAFWTRAVTSRTTASVLSLTLPSLVPPASGADASVCMPAIRE